MTDEDIRAGDLLATIFAALNPYDLGQRNAGYIIMDELIDAGHLDHDRAFQAFHAWLATDEEYAASERGVFPIVRDAYLKPIPVRAQGGS